MVLIKKKKSESLRDYEAVCITALVNDKIATTTKFATIEYEKNFELSQLSEEDCPIYDLRKLPPIKTLNCIVNEVKKLMAHV